jgi:hypothetical protein
VGPYARSSGQRSLPLGFVVRLQQTVGNREVLRLLAAEARPPAAPPASPRARGAWLGTLRSLLCRARARSRES